MWLFNFPILPDHPTPPPILPEHLTSPPILSEHLTSPPILRSTCLLRQSFRSTRFLRQSYRITWLLLQSFRSTWLLRQLLCGLCCSIFSFLCSNIPVSRAYVVYISQHVCYYWSCVQFYGRHHDLVDEYPYHKWEEFEDTKGVSRIRKSKKNIQHNGHMQVLLEYCCIYKWKVHIGKIEINIFFSKDPFWTMLR